MVTTFQSSLKSEVKDLVSLGQNIGNLNFNLIPFQRKKSMDISGQERNFESRIMKLYNFTLDTIKLGGKINEQSLNSFELNVLFLSLIFGWELNVLKSDVSNNNEVKRLKDELDTLRQDRTLKKVFRDYFQSLKINAGRTTNNPYKRRKDMYEALVDFCKTWSTKQLPSEEKLLIQSA